jgi:hypothetical protein
LAILPLLLDLRDAVGLHIGEGEVYLRVFEFIVLVETALAAIGLAACLDGALVVPLNLIGIAPHPLALLIVAVTVAGELVVLHRVQRYFVLAEPVDELVLLVDEVLHLVGERDVGQIQAAVFVIVAVLLH